MTYLRTRTDTLRLAHDVAQIAVRARQDIKEVSALYKSTGADARVAVFANITNILVSGQFTITFCGQLMREPNWWSQHTNIQDPVERDLISQQYMTTVQIGLVQQVFSAVEHSLRRFVRALSPGSCNGGTAAFVAIYKHFYGTVVTTPPAEWDNLLNLFRLIRNTIHNNGMHFDPRQSSTTVTWGGRQFAFTHGAPVRAPWELLLEIFEASRRLARQTVEQPELLAHTALIPSA